MSAAQQQPEWLDPLRFPLRGSALIEASAGTGKTFTIAALYLRLVLGHGAPDAAFSRPLTPPEILVVTFTEAATQELRDRIRARLAAAATAFLQPGVLEDALLQQLRASYREADWPACAQRLRIAAEWMDEAAVSTIHGWCHRMLREHAFDSGSLFEQALQADQKPLQEEAVRDYWRSFFYPLPPADAACIASWWKDPAQLRKAVAGLLPHAATLDGRTACAEILASSRQARVQALARLRQPWPAWCDELQEILDAAVRDKQVHGQKLQARFYTPWLLQLRSWAAGQVDSLALSDSAFKRLSRAGLREAWKLADAAPEHPALEALQALPQQLAALPDGRDQVLAHATCWVAQRLAAEQHRRAEMGFDDLLTRLHAALHRPGNERLAEHIRAQFPVALIDEFQDTDPVQYGIFRRIYRPGDAPDEALQQQTALVLIGDPKQAIYAFRGADIHTYLAARQAAGRLATLGTNYRSSQAMVDAVNHLFLLAEQRPQGEGAFLFRSATGNPLPFIPVAARGQAEQWVVDGAPPPALTCWWLDEGTVLKEGAYREQMGAACAADVVRLLQLGQQGRAGFQAPGRALRPVQPGDIAILVNKREEADAVRAALRAQGVRSVYLSEQENVFRSPAAAELQRLLQACAEPEDGRLVRAALGTALLQLDWPALERLNQDELHWDRLLEQFRGYRQCWQRQGVLPMLRRLLHDFGVPRRLLAAGDERQLTDLLHLAELLQQASTLIAGEHALVRHLVQQRAEAAAVAADNRQLRLESDAALLKVVTVHKSKGLEYPLVFVPFACACRPVQEDDLPLKWHDDQGRLQVTLKADAQLLARSDRERLGEDLRKLYVALTRARHATWIGVAPTADVQRAALGSLLGEPQPLAPGQVQAVLQAQFASCTAARVLPAPQASTQVYQARLDAPLLAPEPPLPARPPERWWIASYSRLRRVDGHAADAALATAQAPESAEEETWLEPAEARAAGVPAAIGAPTSGSAGAQGELDLRPATAAAPGLLHAVPRGAAAGVFLHALLEWAGRNGFAATAGAPQEVAAWLDRRCQSPAWAPHRNALAQWLAQWLQTPLDLAALTPGATPVAPLALDTLQPEMEFWLAASQVQARKLDALVCAHTLDGVQRAPLQAQQLNGMLKGFIDLVFAHEGRYYVADYKSNWLGPTDAHYTRAAMRDEVLHHRYELQYCLYLFALHRLLRARLPDYDYDRHVGGAVYVFLRGDAAPSQGLHLERPPRALMDALDALFAGSGAAA